MNDERGSKGEVGKRAGEIKEEMARERPKESEETEGEFMLNRVICLPAFECSKQTIQTVHSH